MKRYKLKLPQRLSPQLVQAVTDNDVPKLKQLQELGENFSLRDQNKNTLLHLAIQKQIEGSTLDAFTYLLSLNKIPIDDRNSYGYSPLMEAFGSDQDSIEYAIKLIEAGCDVIEPFPDGNSTLHLAIYNKWTEVAELLIERGFEVDCQNSEGETPLHVACRMGCVDDIWMLLFFGADPNFAHITEAQYTNYTTFTLMNFFDMIINPKCKYELKSIFLNELKYEKSFSLMSFIEAMECELDFFYELVEITSDINYTHDDLKAFSQRISTFNPKMFVIFIEKFGFVIEDMLHRCCLDEVFIIDSPSYLENYATNLFTLLQSHLVSTFIDEANDRSLPLLNYLIESFAGDLDKLDTLTQVLCCLLSYGLDMTAEAMISVYYTCGYCKLFKILLHMDIRKMNRCLTFKHSMPRIVFDVNMKIDTILFEENYDEPTVFKLSEFFSLKKGSIQRVPCLVELARNSVREFIIRRLKIKNSMQFYTVLKKLPIAEVHRKIIAFERKLYLL